MEGNWYVYTSIVVFSCSVGSALRHAPGCSRKEVIQPHLPVQLPCYDFVPVTGPALGGRLR
jgi:hypothetical protein